VTDVSLAIAIAAGALSFLSPCVLALLPVYLAFLGEAATGGGTAAAPPARALVLPQALLFVAGFSIVFVVLGSSIGIIGAPLFRIPEARQAAGIVVIALGIVTTGVFGPVLDRFSVRMSPDVLPATRSVRAVALGALVAVGWTPCIGPVLGAILTMGASSGSAPVVPPHDGDERPAHHRHRRPHLPQRLRAAGHAVHLGALRLARALRR
jgi:cytochrome c-type biogenesis protein